MHRQKLIARLTSSSQGHDDIFMAVINIALCEKLFIQYFAYHNYFDEYTISSVHA
jgi:hypothetical protein